MEKVETVADVSEKPEPAWPPSPLF